MRRAGFTLGLTLAVVTLAMVFALTLTGRSVFDLWYCQQNGNAVTAANAAESALALAVSAVIADNTMTYGQKAPFPTLRPADPISGAVSFDSATAASLDIACSLNNLGGRAQAEPALGGQEAPANAVCLVSGGWCQGEVCRMLAVVSYPEFQYAIASNSSIQSPRGLIVGSLPAGANPAQIQPQNLLPAAIASNSIGLDALWLGPQSMVAGDARAGGSVYVAPGARVGGAVEPGSPTLPLPHIDLASLDDATQPNVQPLSGNVSTRA